MSYTQNKGTDPQLEWTGITKEQHPLTGETVALLTAADPALPRQELQPLVLALALGSSKKVKGAVFRAAENTAGLQGLHTSQTWSQLQVRKPANTTARK